MVLPAKGARSTPLRREVYWYYWHSRLGATPVVPTDKHNVLSAHFITHSVSVAVIVFSPKIYFSGVGNC